MFLEEEMERDVKAIRVRRFRDIARLLPLRKILISDLTFPILRTVIQRRQRALQAAGGHGRTGWSGRAEMI